MMKTKLVTDKETGNIWINTVQDVEPILRRNHELSTVLPNHAGDYRWRYVGEIPLVICQQWQKECGAAMGSKEFTEYDKKKLKDPDYKILLVKVGL